MTEDPRSWWQRQAGKAQEAPPAVAPASQEPQGPQTPLAADPNAGNPRKQLEHHLMTQVGPTSHPGLQRIMHAELLPALLAFLDHACYHGTSLFGCAATRVLFGPMCEGGCMELACPKPEACVESQRVSLFGWSRIYISMRESAACGKAQGVCVKGFVHDTPLPTHEDFSLFSSSQARKHVTCRVCVF